MTRLVAPFKAFVPRPDLAAEVAMPPVAAVTADQWDRLTAEKPHSFLHVMRAAIDSPTGGKPPQGPGPSGRPLFDALVASGVFTETPGPGYFVYRLTGEGFAKTGVVAAVAVRGLADGSVLRHEHTRRETEDLIAAHLIRDRLDANPVALAYRADASVDSTVETITKRDPDIDFVADDGIRQSIWVVADEEDVDAIDEAMAAISKLYITDGHHRCAAAMRFAARTGAVDARFVGVLFPDDQVRLHAYNRCVLDSGALSASEIVERIRDLVQVEELKPAWAEDARPRRKGIVAMTVGGRWYRVTLPEPDSADPVERLDVSLLHRHVLQPVLGVEDPRTDARLVYVPGTAGLGELERHASAVCFALHPATLDEVMAVADAGKVMPPKSTWFEPKVHGGLIVRTLDSAAPSSGAGR